MTSNFENNSKRSTFAVAASFAFVLLTFSFSASAGDWPRWGGTPERNMVSTETNLPDSWDPGKKKDGAEDFDPATSKNVKWIAKIGSQCYGNPTVAGGKVFIGTNNTSPRNPKI